MFLVRLHHDLDTVGPPFLSGGSDVERGGPHTAAGLQDEPRIRLLAAGTAAPAQPPGQSPTTSTAGTASPTATRAGHAATT